MVRLGGVKGKKILNISSASNIDEENEEGFKLQPQGLSARQHLTMLKSVLKITDKQIDELLKLRYTTNNTLILNDNDIDIPDHVAVLIGEMGYDQAYDFLKEATDYNRLIFITIEREGIEKIQDEADKINYKTKGTKGLGKCRKCGCEELRQTTIQTRSSDEAKSEFYQCVKCGNKWRQN